VRVDQVIPSLASRDAIGVHTLNVRRALLDAGFDSEIYYWNSTPDMASAGHPVSALGRRAEGRALLYQASIGSPVFEVLLERGEPKLVNYHNITPAELFAGWEPDVAEETALGRAQLARLAPECELAIAVSRFNEEELRAAGYANTAVVPLLMDVTAGRTEPDRLTAARLAEEKSRGGTDLLYVGKISPHKAPHDLVKMLAVYRRLYDAKARLRLVGSPLGERYEPALLSFVDDLGLEDAVEVTGSLPPAELEAYWRAADVYVSASDHEGFCVPLVEAMGHGVPVVVYGAAAVPETVGGAGLVLPTKEPLRFAAAVARVVSDPELRARFAGAAATRVADLSPARSGARFVELVRGALAG
jgi:glycosyltransferase involved in cell wall biosynthesis